MNENLDKLLSQLKGTGGGSKLVAGLVGLAIAIAIGVTALVASRPHFELAFSSLSDHEVARVNKALSDAGISFEVSQPPGPFNVYVDDGDRSQAYMAVYGAGALDKPLKGIIAESGMSSVFQGSEERMQVVQKREWQEMEGILEALDFVRTAHIRTSPRSTSPLVSFDESALTASVTLVLPRFRALTDGQTDTVANLVSRGLGIPKENLIVSDQSGNSLFDGALADRDTEDPADLLGIKEQFDKQAADAANQLLIDTLGQHKARVTVSSEWDFDQSTTTTETPSKGSLVSEMKSKKEQPLDDGPTPVGVAANIPDDNEAFGIDQAGAGGSTGEPRMATTTEETKSYEPAVTRVQLVHSAPLLKRMTVAAFFDESIDQARADELAEAIKAAVGFDPSRSDEFKYVILPFATAPLAEEGSDTGGDAVPEPVEETSPFVETLLERGVEIVIALVFIVLLLKSLRSSRATLEVTGEPSAGEVADPDAIDPELLARAHIDELLKTEPDKVGRILSRWAREDLVTAKADR